LIKKKEGFSRENKIMIQKISRERDKEIEKW